MTERDPERGEGDEAKRRASACRTADERSTVDGIESLSHAATEEVASMERWPLDVRGNVFGQVGVADPEVRLLVASLILEVHVLIRAERVSPADAAAALGIDDSTLQRVLGGRRVDLPLIDVVRALAVLGYRAQVRLLRIPAGESTSDAG